MQSQISQLIWIYTVCKGRVYPVSAGQELTVRVVGLWEGPAVFAAGWVRAVC